MSVLRVCRDNGQGKSKIIVRFSVRMREMQPAQKAAPSEKQRYEYKT